MPNPPSGQQSELARLAEELLQAMRTIAAEAAAGQQNLGGGGPSVARMVSDTAVKSAEFAAAAANSPDIAEIVKTSPPLAALTVVSRDLAKIATDSPHLGELAVLSPGVARLAAKAPEIAELALSSPPLAAMMEAALNRLGKP
jgi:hypothetical protein